MALRFLADHCISNSIVEALSSAGHEVLKLRDVMPQESPDSAVIEKAQELGAILLSLNGDFADIVTYPPSKYRGIVCLQLRNHPETIPNVMARLIAYLHSEVDRRLHLQGKLVLVEPDRIRVRS